MYNECRTVTNLSLSNFDANLAEFVCLNGKRSRMNATFPTPFTWACTIAIVVFRRLIFRFAFRTTILHVFRSATLFEGRFPFGEFYEELRSNRLQTNVQLTVKRIEFLLFGVLVFRFRVLIRQMISQIGNGQHLVGATVFQTAYTMQLTRFEQAFI